MKKIRRFCVVFLFLLLLLPILAVPAAAAGPVSGGRGIPLLALLLGVVLLAAALAFLPSILRRPKNAVPVSLRSVMENYPQGMGTEGAVSRLMPVIVQLRDRHNNGSLHLQISPDTICFESGRYALPSPSSQESARYSSGFTSPEVYTGSGLGIASDIYSICAVLLYAISGITPENALSRKDGEEIVLPDSLENEEMRSILRRGLSMRPEDRFSSVQELITRLVPFNLTSVSASPVPAAETQPQKSAAVTGKKKRPVWFVAAGAAVLLGVYFLTCAVSAGYAMKGEFSKADQWLILPSLDGRFNRYVAAGRLYEARDYEAANNAFLELPGYRYANDFANESVYRYAAQLADANDFDYAIGLYRNLEGVGYKDAAEKIKDTQYREGVYLLQNIRDYNAALNVFSQLEKDGYPNAGSMIKETYYEWAKYLYAEKSDYVQSYKKMKEAKGYADAEIRLSTIAESVYLQAIDEYKEGDNIKAQADFKLIDPYESSRDYLDLISVKLSYSNSKQMFERLLPHIGFEDANSLLLRNQVFAKYFLAGSWNTDRRQTMLIIEESGDMTDNMPRIISGNGYYYIQDGQVLSYKKADDRQSAKPDKLITVIDYNTIQVYCYKDGSTYTLYRE